MSNTESKIEKMKKEEFDVDTGTYMEDVHSNDLIGIDVDGNGLIDNVEELIEEADRRAREENNEKERIEHERQAKEENAKDENTYVSGCVSDFEFDM